MSQPNLVLGPTDTDWNKEIALREIETKINQLIAQIDEGGLVGPHAPTHELGGSDEVHLDWTQILGTPTTLAGYGITDAYTKTEVDGFIAAIEAEIAALTFADIGGQLDYSQLPTGGGTWANGGALLLTGGALAINSGGLTVAAGPVRWSDPSGHSIGGAPNTRYGLFYLGTHAPSGTTQGDAVFRISTTVTARDTVGVYAFWLSPTVTKPGLGTTLPFVTSARFDSPAISGSGTVTTATSAWFRMASGGTSNYAMFSDGPLRFEGTQISTTPAISMLVQGSDTVARFEWTYGGKMSWGDGSNPLDLSIERSAAATMKLTGDLIFPDATYDIGKSGATRPRDGFFSRNVTISGLLGVGVTPSLSTLDVMNEVGSTPVAQLTQYTTTAGSNLLRFRKARGTAASPTQVLSGDAVGNFAAFGYHSGGAFTGSAVASIAFIATENFTSTAWGTDITFNVNTIGTVSRVERLRVSGSGVTVSTDLLFPDATYDIGKTGATRPRDYFGSRDVTVGRDLVIGSSIFKVDTQTALADGETNLLINRKAAGVEAQVRGKWIAFASLGATDKVFIVN